MPRVTIKESGGDRFFDKIARQSENLENIKTSFANKLRLIEQASQPDLQVNGEVVLWLRTGDDVLFIIARANDTDRKIQLS